MHSQKPFNKPAHDLPSVLTHSEERPVPAPFLLGKRPAVAITAPRQNQSSVNPVSLRGRQSPVPQMHTTAWRFVHKFVGKICINPNIALIKKEDGRRAEDKESTTHRRPRSARAQTQQHPGDGGAHPPWVGQLPHCTPQEKVTQEHQCPAS